jgi:hypothetical protein
VLRGVGAEEVVEYPEVFQAHGCRHVHERWHDGHASVSAEHLPLRAAMSWKVRLQAFDSCPHLHERHLFLLLTRRWHCWGAGDRNRDFPLPMLLNATISTDTLFLSKSIFFARDFKQIRAY